MAERAPRATSTRLRKLMHFKASARPASRLRCWPHCMERARGKPCHWRARKWHCLLPGLPYLEPPFLRGPSGLITDSSRPSLSPRLSGERCCWRLSVSGELGGLTLSGEAGGLPLPPPLPWPEPLRLRHSSMASSPTHSAKAPAEAQNHAPPPRPSMLPAPGVTGRAAERPPPAPAEVLGVALGWVALAALPVGGGGV